MDQISQNLEQKWQKNPINHQKGAQPCNKGPDQEAVRYMHPYILRSTYSSSFMDLN